MMLSKENYPVATEACGMVQTTLTDRLEREQKQLTARLAKIDTILTALKRNSEIQGLLDMISELGGF